MRVIDLRRRHAGDPVARGGRAPRAGRGRDRRSARCGAAQLEPHAPRAARRGIRYGTFGERDPEPDAAIIAYVDLLHDAIVEACREAVAALEPAWVWGLGYADER